MLLRQSGETLAGRVDYVDLGPLSVLEVAPDRDRLHRLWLRGGFPDSFLAASDDDSLRLRRSFIRTYLERDVPMFGPRIPAETLEQLWTMLAHNQGTLLNASRPAGKVSSSRICWPARPNGPGRVSTGPRPVPRSTCCWSRVGAMDSGLSRSSVAWPRESRKASASPSRTCSRPEPWWSTPARTVTRRGTA